MASQSSTPGRLTNKDLAAAARKLAARDSKLAASYNTYGPPPMWGRPQGFITLLRIVLEQQVSLVSARAIFNRIKLNTDPFTPERFIELDEPYFRSLGLTRQKAHYCVEVARTFSSGHLKALNRMPDEEARAALLSIKGVGPWTANIYLLMALRRPDIWPTGDIALASAVGRLGNMKTRPSFGELEKMAEAWRPFRSVAARMLWHYYLERRKEERQERSRSVTGQKGNS